MNPFQSLNTQHTNRKCFIITSNNTYVCAVLFQPGFFGLVSELKLFCVCFMYLFGTAFKDHILLTLVQSPFPHGPEVENSVLSLQKLIENI